MDDPFQALRRVFDEGAEDAARIAGALWDPWTQVQLAVILGAILAATLLNRRLEPRLEARLRELRGRPRTLRILVVALRRLRWAFLALLLWTAAVVMRSKAAGPPAVVSLAAWLTLAWVAISIVSKVVRNRLASRAVAIVGWGLFALEMLGWLDPIAEALQERALPLGTYRLPLLSIVQAIGLLMVLVWLAVVVSGGLETRLRRSTDLTPSLQVLIGKVVRIALFIVAVVVALSAVGVDLGALTLLTGALGLGLGFGLQTVVSNFVSGLIILVDKSIKPGDVVEVGGQVGWIRSLRARFVSVVTRDGREILVPNEDFITERVVNWSFSDTKARLDVCFGVSYASDPHEVRRLARGAAAGVPRVIASPAPVCHITAFGDSSIDFILRFWIEDAQNGLTNVRGDVFLALWDALKAAGITIPFPHREIILRSSEDLGRPDQRSRP